MATCAACEASGLAAHLAVAGELGDQGLAPATTQFGTALGDIVRCLACGHMQLDRLPPAVELERAYAATSADDYVSEEHGQRATARALLGRIERRVAAGELLDLGCWLGFLLAEARERGWSTLGVEPSRFASDYARRRLGLDVRTSALTEVELAPQSFDAVVMADVIEHLPEPSSALAQARTLLRPHGVLALALPDAGSLVARALGRRWWSVIPTHVHYFTRTSMLIMLKRAGLTPIELASAPKAFTVAYYLSRTAGYSPALAAALVRAARALGVAGRLWAPDFRDRMLVLSTPAATPGT